LVSVFNEGSNEYIEAWDMEVDVVIVGAGAAGLAAAIEAADSGAQTMVLEKQASGFDCSSALSAGIISFAGTDLQKKLGIEDSNNKLRQDIMDIGEWKSDPKLVSTYVSNQLDTYKWLTKLGVKWGACDRGAGMSVPRGHSTDPVQLIRILTETAKGRGVKIRYQARVTGLLTDKEKRVIGVKVEEEAGTAPVRVRKGVVLATGGFSRDTERLRSLDPRYVTLCIATSGKGHTGDGHRLAKGLGAYETDIEYVMPSFGQHVTGTSVAEFSFVYYRGAIIVNKKGHRYVNESVSYKDIGMATLDQPDGIGFQLFDHKVFDEAVRRIEEHKSLIPPKFALDGLDKGRTELLVKGNTIEELASQMNVLPEVLKETVDRYNSFVDGGKDLDFGRTTLVGKIGKIIKIDSSPFYAYESKSAWASTYGGIAVDENMHVLSADGTIPRVYAAGELIGGFHGASYHTGTALGKALIFGRIAGKNTVSGS